MLTARCVRYAATQLGSHQVVICLLLAMSVPSQFADLVMNMSARTATSPAHSARPVTRDTKVL